MVLVVEGHFDEELAVSALATQVEREAVEAPGLSGSEERNDSAVSGLAPQEQVRHAHAERSEVELPVHVWFGCGTDEEVGTGEEIREGLLFCLLLAVKTDGSEHPGEDLYFYLWVVLSNPPQQSQRLVDSSAVEAERYRTTVPGST